MRLKMVLVAVAAVLALPAALRAEDTKSPAIVVKVKSVEGILADVHYLAKLAGPDAEDKLKQAEGILEGFKGKEGLGGIDMKRPIGLYATITAGLQDSPVVVLLPIADEKAFIDFLGNYEIKPKKDDDGVYTIENIPNVPVPVSVYFRFDKKYAHITAMEKGNIDKKKLLDPAKVLGDVPEMLSAHVKVSELPDILKQIALGQVDNVLTQAKEKKSDDEPAAVTKLREKVLDFINEELKAVLTDGEDLNLKIGIDTKKDDVTFDLSFKAKAGTQLAKDMEAAGKSKTLFAGLASKDDAVTVNGTVVFPEEIKKSLAPALEAAIKDAIAKEKDQVKQALMKKAAEAVMPTLKAGEIDGGLSLRGPNKDGHYTAVGGMKLKDGKGIESFLRDLVKNMPEKDKEKITIDAASAGDVKIHKVTVDNMGEQETQIFGSNAVYFAIRDDAILVSLGADGLAAIKEAVDLKPGDSKAVLSVVVATARAAGLDVKEKKAAKVAKDVFGSDPKGSDTITVTLEMAQTARLKVNVKGKVIAFGAKTAEANK
jgi:hypothetical protein